MCTPLAPSRNKIIYKTACSNGPNSGSGKLCQNRLRSKRASLVARPVAISHKVSLKPKHCDIATLTPKTFKNELKHGGPIFLPHAQLSKRTFTVPFLGPSGGTKNETAKSQNPQQRPTPATNKKLQVRSFKQPAYRVGTEVRLKPDFN